MRIAIMLGIATLLGAADLSQVIESPDATAILKKDALPAPKVYAMPAGCISEDPAVIARGKYIFHNLNGKDAKDPAPEGLVKILPDGKEKQFGNCVACHNIEGAKGYGNIGPDLSNYKGLFMDSGARKAEFVYQKIADARVDNPVTHMTINMTNGLMNEREVCDLTSYIVSKK
ncbi:sulfur oxidation c-type cytochrome SoxX [Sulfuricurvum sp.]|uniref:sulfur oxidation c-type cytochrome SoxX n=1 Tax=Sulfuricurvum sp. TaxID=2025608 RepID=UPI002639CD86|nr:sulfur oxidation c-type cytochrome SoxX [Sulfuricurvum sp.]MDD2265394.1 sulfur oxidation c-type cytochrome SoxX [Sulfuricurvum sp.]MDD2784472.1 sulfur oxidation c-type cytochrome SoxX [Sulfuricurvum sp.]